MHVVPSISEANALEILENIEEIYLFFLEITLSNELLRYGHLLSQRSQFRHD